MTKDQPATAPWAGLPPAPRVRLRRACLAGCLGLALFALSSCAKNKVDWNSRVGTYTHDDAVRELGPPDKSARLTDGSVVSDWLTGHGTQTATAYPGGWYPYGRGRYGHAGPGYVVVDPPAPDRFLRLTFDPQGRLASWARVYK